MEKNHGIDMQDNPKAASSNPEFKVTGRQSPDCAASSTMTIETADGVEQVNINMGTGEISYGPSACEIEG